MRTTTDKYASVLLWMAACALSAGPQIARAGTAWVDLDCFTSPSPDPWAELDDRPSGTSTGSGVETESFGWSFVHTDDRQIQCQWTVPNNYDSSGADPVVRISGWSKDCVICVPGVTCGTTRNVEFEVSSRAYSSGDLANASWGAVDEAVMTWTSESCGSPCSTDCYQADRVKQVEADATDDAANWSTGDIVYIQIMRDESVTNDLPAGVHVARVRLAYPTS